MLESVVYNFCFLLISVVSDENCEISNTSPNHLSFLLIHLYKLLLSNYLCNLLYTHYKMLIYSSKIIYSTEKLYLHLSFYQILITFNISYFWVSIRI